MAGRNGSIASHTSELRPFLSRVKVSDRQREPLCRERLGEASGLYDVAIIEHGVDRVRGVFGPKKALPLPRRAKRIHDRGRLPDFRSRKPSS